MPRARLGTMQAPVVDAEFMMYKAKCEGVLCPKPEPHNHSSCPYLHPQEQGRRDPLLYRYDSIFCYDLHNTKCCKRGLNCPYSHSVWEYYLHPSRYRTKMCEYGEQCTRGLCFFAHSEAELRPRVAIKTHSGGRRSGRRYKAAAAAQAGAAAAAAATGSDDEAAAAVGSPSVTFLHVPSLPGASTEASSSCGSYGLPLELSAQHEALSRLSLDTGVQQDAAGTLQGTPLLAGLLQPPPPPPAVLRLQGMGPAGEGRSSLDSSTAGSVLAVPGCSAQLGAAVSTQHQASGSFTLSGSSLAPAQSVGGFGMVPAKAVSVPAGMGLPLTTDTGSGLLLHQGTLPLSCTAPAAGGPMMVGPCSSGPVLLSSGCSISTMPAVMALPAANPQQELVLTYTAAPATGPGTLQYGSGGMGWAGAGTGATMLPVATAAGEGSGQVYVLGGGISSALPAQQVQVQQLLHLGGVLGDSTVPAAPGQQTVLLISQPVSAPEQYQL